MPTLRIYRIVATLAVALSFGCDKRTKKKETHEHHEELKKLKEKKALYCELGKAHGESTQWNIHSCDSLLFASLWSVACGEEIPLENFFDENGKAYRTTTKDCFISPESTSNGSKTSISKDMYRGAFYAMLRYGRLDLVQRTISYGSENSWVMGEGVDSIEVASRCVMSPTMISQLYDIESYLLGETPINDHEKETETSLTGKVGFRAHLETLTILFENELYDGVTDGDVETLKEHALRQPDNSLYAFAAHSFDHSQSLDQAISVLMNETYFPSDRLPKASDRCAEYLFQHEKEDVDWLPCEGGQHSGTDLAFAVYLLENSK